MPISPFTGTADAETKVNVNFTSGHVDLKNIDFATHLKKIEHVLQAEGKHLTRYATYEPITKGTFKWCHLVDQRNPVKRTTESPVINSRATTFKTFGMVVQSYDDDSLVPDYTENGAILSVKASTFQAIKKGFMRLLDQLIITGCVQPQISRDSSTKNSWKQGTFARTETAFPDSQIFGRIVNDTKTNVSASLTDPSFKTFQLLKKSLFEKKFPRSEPIYSVLNPRMEYVLEQLVQYYNKDFIFAQTKQALHEKAEIVPFYGINFIRVDNDILPQGVYNSKKFAKGASGVVNELQAITSTAVATGDVDLGDGSSSSQRYTVIPFWSKRYLYWASNPSLAIASMFRVPNYKMTPLVTMTEYLGATRAQNAAFANLVIPRDATET